VKYGAVRKWRRGRWRKLDNNEVGCYIVAQEKALSGLPNLKLHNRISLGHSNGPKSFRTLQHINPSISILTIKSNSKLAFGT
jgi:hypothetical protein